MKMTTAKWDADEHAAARSRRMVLIRSEFPTLGNREIHRLEEAELTTKKKAIAAIQSQKWKPRAYGGPYNVGKKTYIRVCEACGIQVPPLPPGNRIISMRAQMDELLTKLDFVTPLIEHRNSLTFMGGNEYDRGRQDGINECIAIARARQQP